MKEDGVHLMWKAKGLTMGRLLEQFKHEHAECADLPVTYAGRLDPMAEGVVILLAGHAVHRKDEFLHLDKVYEFECLWGFETDTFDALGKVLKASAEKPSGEAIEKMAQSFVGKQAQAYPAYSSRKVEGKPMFEWAREGKLDEIEAPAHEVEIYSLGLVSHRSIFGGELLNDIEEQISKVNGDFRQEEILKLWREILEPLKGKEFLITRMTAHVSSGTYIRTLADEMGKKLGCGALAYSIMRRQVGDLHQ